MQVSPLCKASEVMVVGKAKVAKVGTKEEGGMATVAEEEGVGEKGQPEFHHQHHQHHQLSCDYIHAANHHLTMPEQCKSY